MIQSVTRSGLGHGWLAPNVTWMSNVGGLPPEADYRHRDRENRAAIPVSNVIGRKVGRNHRERGHPACPWARKMRAFPALPPFTDRILSNSNFDGIVIP